MITPWQRFIGLIQLDKAEIRQIIYYAIFAGLVALTLPLGIQAIINLIQGAQVTTSWIVLVALVTLGVGFQGTLQLMQLRILENIQQKIFTRASFEFAYRFPKIRMKEFNSLYPPELANKFFDTIVVQKGLSKILLDFPAAILQIIFGLILLSFYHPFFIVYGIMLVLLVYLVFKFTAAKGLQTSLQESTNKYKVAHWIQEIARALVSFKLSGRTSLAMKKTDKYTRAYLESRESHFQILKLQFIQMIGFKVLVTAGLLIIGGFLVLDQEMNIGQFVAAEIIIILIISSVEKLITGLEIFYDLLTSLEKLGEVVDKKLENLDGVDPFETEQDLKINLTNLSVLKWNKESLIENLNLTIDQKDRILFKGPSGSGKTTLLKVIANLISPSGGNISVNGYNLTNVNPNFYRSRVGQVLPEQLPFEGTILENITFGNTEVSMDEVNEVIRVLELEEFLKTQKKGLLTKIFPEGQKIPRTVTMQIMLARAIVGKPKLLILKDALENFEPRLTTKLMAFLAHSDRPWALLVCSNSEEWTQYITREVNLSKQ